MSWVNIYEQPIMPNVDLEEDTVVYVPGYAIKGPSEPTLVNSTNFERVFGETPYTIPAGIGTASIAKNKIPDGGREKSWLYAKGLVDAGLTVLYHRYIGANAAKANKTDAFKIDSSVSGILDTGISINVRAKYAGAYYNGLVVNSEKVNNGVSKITVKNDSETLETAYISFDANALNYLANTEFSYIEIFGTSNDTTLSISQLCDLISAKLTTPAAIRSTYITNKTTAVTLDAGTDDFSVSDFEDALVGKNSQGYGAEALCEILKDSERYPVSYITTGGYFVDYENLKPNKIFDVASEVKACYTADFANELTYAGLDNYKQGIEGLNLDDYLKYSYGFQVVGADTFSSNNSRVILPDSFGYLVRLGLNIKAGLPNYTPVANNSQGLVANAINSTRPIDFKLEQGMITSEGVSINPVITKKNVGYVIMGNRTLYPNNGELGPQSFLNCRVVVNMVERSARKAANKLRIVSTNPDTAFKNFRNMVEKTCDKLLTNGDGLAEYSISKLPKTKPATIEIQIKLTVVEGIETFNIYIPYSIALD